MDLSFVILTWNSEAYIKRCIESVGSQCDREGIVWEAIVVDNGSADHTLEILGRELPAASGGRVSVIALDRNRGTTYPRNLGYRNAQGDCVCTLDSDIEFRKGSIRGVLNRIKVERSVGIVAPKLVFMDGRPQNSVKKFPTVQAKLMKIPRAVLRIPTPNLDFYPDFCFERETVVDSAISAAWFFRADILDKIGYLDERIFYSPEDLDYCMRVRKSGYDIVFSPIVEFIHHTQQISHRSPLSAISLRHFAGLMYYFTKHRCWFARPKFPPFTLAA